MSPVTTKSKYGKISKPYIVTPPMCCHRGVSNLKIILQSNFGYCTTTQTLNIALYAAGAELRTDGWTNGQADGRSDYMTVLHSTKRSFRMEAYKSETSQNFKLVKS